MGEPDLGFLISDLTEAVREANKAQLRSQSSPSLASIVGTRPAEKARGFGGPIDTPAKAYLSGALGRDYLPGMLVTALWGLKGNPDEYAAAKATLDGLGLQWMDTPEASKATLGNTGATGGYVLPNNLVDTVYKPKTMEAVYGNLVTTRTGINVRGVDQPFRTGAPARMQFQDWGQTKENVNEAYGSYTANLGTMARIYDIGKQYLRFSAGAAEQDVLDELTRAAVLGENYYMLAGAGTGTVGTGDPTEGVYTSLTRPGLQYTTAFQSASNSTVAGSFAAACAAGIKALASRAVQPTAIVTDAVTLWSAIVQGSDTAGFWVNPAEGPTGFTMDANGQLRFWGTPVYWDANFDTNTGTTKRLIVADWTRFRLYRGLEFRIESSDQAGTRWDLNLVGYRGEQEIGFHAAPAVMTGAAQLVTSVIP
jgi:HK97 family phage major capsid protein